MLFSSIQSGVLVFEVIELIFAVEIGAHWSLEIFTTRISHDHELERS